MFPNFRIYYLPICKYLASETSLDSNPSSNNSINFHIWGHIRTHYVEYVYLI